MTKETLKFGRYEAIGELGRGSMGVVYKARDPVIGRMVAIKSIPETFGLRDNKREEFIRRLRQEAMTAGRLQHPSIVTIHDVGETEIGPFIAMEYLDGVTLRDVISAGKQLSMPQLLDIVTQVADGLDYAHSKAIIHRDVKPANLMIVADNRVKIMDLGIARIPMSELTKEGKLVGSPSYMSPEQLTGKKIDGRSDLFSLGVCVYQLMTFKKPFPGESISEICYKIVNDDFVAPSEHWSDAPPEFDDFMRVALSKRPEDRFQTGKELVDALMVVAERSGIDLSPSEDLETATSSIKVSAMSGRKDDKGTVSNPAMTHSSTIDTIFKDLTYTARTVDLSKQSAAGSSGPSPWMIIVGAALLGAAVVALLLWLF